MIIQKGQNIFDLTLQGFGTLDNIVKVSNDNLLSITDDLDVNTDIVIDNEDLGVANIKAEINNNSLLFNNDIVPFVPVWILATGLWDDYGVWIDTELWID